MQNKIGQADIIAEESIKAIRAKATLLWGPPQRDLWFIDNEFAAHKRNIMQTLLHLAGAFFHGEKTCPKKNEAGGNPGPNCS
jgi:hypothetical protein